MQQLSNLDASFLYLESPQSPMHIGCILTFAAPTSGNMSFQRFKHFIASRLPTSPIFRRRLAGLPLNIDRPYWVEDQNFDIDSHLQHIQLQDESDTTQRNALINHFFSQNLNPALPLWDMLYIDRPDNAQGEFSVLLKFHHAAVDGMSAEKILTGLLSPCENPISPIVDSWKPESPSVTRMVSNKLRSLYHTPAELVAFTQHLGHAVKRSRQLRQRDKGQQPPYFFMSPHSPFNGEVEPTRQINSAHLLMTTVKAVKNAYPGCTVNDVVLAVCAGALRQLLISLDQLPDAPLVAMAPVSKREGSEREQGNLISAMLISLATDIASPLSRLEAIQKNACTAKEYNREVAMEQVITHLPSWTSSLVLKTYTRFRIANRLKPVFNLIITNVPGSPRPLYMDGAQLTSMEGMAPIVDGMGLTLVVTSYIDRLTIAVTSTADMATHMHDFIGHLDHSLNELYSAVMPTHATQPEDASTTNH